MLKSKHLKGSFDHVSTVSGPMVALNIVQILVASCVPHRSEQLACPNAVSTQ